MLKKQKLIIISVSVAVIVVIGIIAFIAGMTNKESLSISGILEADNSEIPTLISGVVKEVRVTEGDEVRKGDILVTLDDTELSLKKKQAESLVAQAEAQLEMIKSGASPSEIKQMQAKVNQAKANLQNIASGARPEEIAQAQAKTDSAKAAYDKATSEFEKAQRLYEEDIISKSKLEELELAANNAKSMFTSADQALKLLKKGASPQQIQIAQQQVAASNAALSNILEGARPSQIKVAQAQIDQSQAELDLISTMIANSHIKSPITGTINVLSVNQGELITKGAPVASVLDLENLWVKVFVPETSLVFLRLGQPAIIKPDALPELSFPGRISFIAQNGAFIPPGTKESVDQQVFEVKIKLEKTQLNNVQLRPGMSVNVKIDISDNKKRVKEATSTRKT